MTVSYVTSLLAAPADAGSFADTQALTIGSGASTLQAGDVAALFLISAGNSVPATITDSRGNTWSKLVSFYDSSVAATTTIAAAALGTVLQAADTVSIGFGAGDGVPLVAALHAFRGATVTVDGTASAVDGYGAAWATPSVTTTVTGDLLLSMLTASNPHTDTPASGNTDLTSFTGTNYAKYLLAQWATTGTAGATHGGGTLNSVDSYTGAVAALKAGSGTPSAPTNSVAPTITGTAQQGVALSASSGTWTGSPSYAYPWQSSPDGTTWTNITGATSATYTPVSGDVGKHLRVAVTATNGGGSATVDSAQTAATAGPAPGPVSPPVVTAPVLMTGMFFGG